MLQRQLSANGAVTQAGAVIHVGIGLVGMGAGVCGRLFRFGLGDGKGACLGGGGCLAIPEGVGDCGRRGGGGGRAGGQKQTNKEKATDFFHGQASFF